MSLPILGLCGNTRASGNCAAVLIAVPFLNPALSSRWLTLVTPVYASIGRFLIESVRTPSAVRDPEAAAFSRSDPGFGPAQIFVGQRPL